MQRIFLLCAALCCAAVSHAQKWEDLTFSDLADFKVNWQRFCFTDVEVSQRSTDFDKIVYEGRDLWFGGKPFRTNRVREVVVPAEDVVLYRLTPVKKK